MKVSRMRIRVFPTIVMLLVVIASAAAIGQAGVKPVERTSVGGSQTDRSPASLSGIPDLANVAGHELRSTGLRLCDGLALYYDFETLVDTQVVNKASGIPDGTLQGGAVLASGKVGSGILCDGVDDDIEVEYAATVWDVADSVGYTFAAWVKFDNNQPQAWNAPQLLSRPLPGGEALDFISDDGHTFRWAHSGVTCFETTDLTDGNWHQVVATVSGGRGLVYVDAVLEGNASWGSLNPTGYRPSPEDHIWLMAYRSGAQMRNVKGTLDEVGWWKRSLTEQEIALLYNSGQGLSYTALCMTPCDTLRIDPVKLYYGPDGCRAPVNLSNCTPLKGATIPLTYDPLPAGWHFDSVSFVGGRMSDWDYMGATYDPVGRTIVINGIVNTNAAGKAFEPAGAGALGYLWFSPPPLSGGTCTALDDNFCIDTTTVPGLPSPKKLILADTSSPPQGFVPVVERGCVTQRHFVQLYEFNCDLTLDVLDIIGLIDCAFLNQCPEFWQIGDGNCDGVLDVFDIIGAIDCIFSGGECPQDCGAPAVAYAPKLSSVQGIGDLTVTAKSASGWSAVLAITTPVPWRAAQFEWTFDGAVDQLSVTIGEGAAGLKTYWNLDGQRLKVGLIDISGEAQIPAGSRPVLRLSGSGDFPGVRLTDGVLVDQNNQGISVSPAGAGAISGIPSSFSLGANYPNPFNAGTVIHYTLGTAGPAKLEVFNILGSHVRTLVDESKCAGPHEVAWDGTDGRGRAAASGMYFYRLTAGGFADSKKMVLLK